MPACNYTVRVPGKLMVAGEYAILEPGQQAVVIAVDRYMKVAIERSRHNLLSFPQWGLERVAWNCSGNRIPNSRLRYVQNAMLVVQKLLQEHCIQQQMVHLTIRSELDAPSGQKYGLGSSAAVVVAVIQSLLYFYANEKIQPSLEAIFKLAAIAHLKTQGNGSCADIAASTYGGWIAYTAFRRKWLDEQLQAGREISALIAEPWPELKMAHLDPPPMLTLCVGWTGEKAATATMIRKLQQGRRQDLNTYNTFLHESARAVANLIQSFKTGDCLGAMASLSQNRKALVKLNEQTNVPIETTKLKTLADIAEMYGSGKASGAGGGDCGIAFVKGDVQAEKLKQAWRDVGIIPLDLHVSRSGAVLMD